MKNQRHEQYLREAESRFYNADGDGFAFDGDYPELGGNYAADGVGDIYWGAAGGQGRNRMGAGVRPVEEAQDFARTYTITVENANLATTSCTLFAANQNANAANFGNAVGITVTLGEATYAELLAETQTKPFTTSGIRLSSSSSSQLDQVLTIRKKEADGKDCAYPLQTANYFSAFQQQATIREIAPYIIEVTGSTQVTFNVLASTTMVFTVFIGRKYDAAKQMYNRPDVVSHSSPLPFERKLPMVAVTAVSGGLRQGRAGGNLRG